MANYQGLHDLDVDVDIEYSRILQDFYPARAYRFMDDFFVYDTGDWTLTTVEGAGSATEAIDTANRGGVLKVTNGTADDDSDEFQSKGETFYLTANKHIFFEARLKVSDATQSDLIVGLCITDTTLLGGLSDGVYFIKDDGDANIDFVTEKDSTETKTDTGEDLVDDTYVTLSFKWDGVSQITAYVDGELVATHTTNLPNDEMLTVSFGIKNGEAAAKILYMDYVFATQVR